MKYAEYLEDKKHGTEGGEEECQREELAVEPGEDRPEDQHKDEGHPGRGEQRRTALVGKENVRNEKSRTKAPEEDGDLQERVPGKGEKDAGQRHKENEGRQRCAEIPCLKVGGDPREPLGE